MKHKIRSVVRSAILTTASGLRVSLEPPVKISARAKHLIYIEAIQMPQIDEAQNRDPVLCQLQSPDFPLNIHLLVPYPVFEVKYQKRESLSLSKINRACLDNMLIPVERGTKIDIYGSLLRSRNYAPFLVVLLHFAER